MWKNHFYNEIRLCNNCISLKLQNVILTVTLIESAELIK